MADLNLLSSFDDRRISNDLNVLILKFSAMSKLPSLYFLSCSLPCCYFSSILVKASHNVASTSTSMICHDPSWRTNVILSCHPCHADGRSRSECRCESEGGGGYDGGSLRSSPPGLPVTSRVRTFSDALLCCLLLRDLDRGVLNRVINPRILQPPRNIATARGTRYKCRFYRMWLTSVPLVVGTGLIHTPLWCNFYPGAAWKGWSQYSNIFS